MPATAVAPAQLALPFLLPEPPSTVDGVPGQLDLVAAVFQAVAEGACGRCGHDRGHHDRYGCHRVTDGQLCDCRRFTA